MTRLDEVKEYFINCGFEKESVLAYLSGFISSYSSKSKKADLVTLLYDVKMILEASRSLPTGLDKFLSSK